MNELATFTVEFIGNNHLPFFDPALTSYLQIYRQASFFVWSYPIPETFDEDNKDMLTVTVDLGDTAEFMTFTDGELKIDDLSDEIVPSGTFSVIVVLSDGTESVITDITVIIYDPPVFADTEEEAPVSKADIEVTLDSVTDDDLPIEEEVET
jgi:hypothetical protein